jgi:hypothetical protein
MEKKSTSLANRSAITALEGISTIIPISIVSVTTTPSAKLPLLDGIH